MRWITRPGVVVGVGWMGSGGGCEAGPCTGWYQKLVVIFIPRHFAFFLDVEKTCSPNDNKVGYLKPLNYFQCFPMRREFMSALSCMKKYCRW